MEVHYGYENLKLNKPVVTMGVFDGVHLGHRKLISMVVDEAGKRGVDSAVVTFDPHPRLVLDNNNDSLRFLTDITERIMLLRETGIGHVIVINFTRELSNLTAEEFIEEILCEKLGITHFITGFSHHFGRRQEGTGETIFECSKRLGFTTSMVGPLSVDGVVVSSSAIRDMLLSGRIREAAVLLGYPYFLAGRVVPGMQIGRYLGFPTANIEPRYRHKIVPLNGVYAVEIEIEGDNEKRIAMLNIGTRPTVCEEPEFKTIEAHIIDFAGDIYNKEVVVKFLYRLRDERKFGSKKKLAEQLRADREMTISLLR